MDVNELISQIQSAILLYAELLLVLALTGLLGLVTGYFLRRSKYKRNLSYITTSADERYALLEKSTRRDAEQLEEQLQSLAAETKLLQTRNRALTDTVKRNDTNAQKSRAESIELNRRHTETQERLQRIIQQKDSELAELANQKKSTKNTAQLLDSAYSSSLNSHLDDNLHIEDTIAFLPQRRSTPALKNESHLTKNRIAYTSNDALDNSDEFDSGLNDTLDATTNISEVGLEDSTVALTDETLAIAHQSFKKRTKDQ